MFVVHGRHGNVGRVSGVRNGPMQVTSAGFSYSTER